LDRPGSLCFFFRGGHPGDCSQVPPAGDWDSNMREQPRRDFHSESFGMLLQARSLLDHFLSLLRSSAIFSGLQCGAKAHGVKHVGLVRILIGAPAARPRRGCRSVWETQPLILQPLPRHMQHGHPTHDRLQILVAAHGSEAASTRYLSRMQSSSALPGAGTMTNPDGVRRGSCPVPLKN